MTSAQAAQAKHVLATLSRNDLWSEFTGVNGALALKDPLPVVQAKYDLSAADVELVQSILTFDKQRQATAPTSGAGVVSPDVFMNGTVIYFTFSEVGALLITAAMAGPWALLAALDAIAAMFGGPIGAAIGFILGMIGVGTLTSLAYQIVQGYFMREGIYFGITWNGIFPNYVQGNWCGCN